jgi:hypothetical protein
MRLVLSVISQRAGASRTISKNLVATGLWPVHFLVATALWAVQSERATPGVH